MLNPIFEYADPDTIAKECGSNALYCPGDGRGVRTPGDPEAFRLHDEGADLLRVQVRAVRLHLQTGSSGGYSTLINNHKPFLE